MTLSLHVEKAVRGSGKSSENPETEDRGRRHSVSVPSHFSFLSASSDISSRRFPSKTNTFGAVSVNSEETAKITSDEMEEPVGGPELVSGSNGG